jgi:hypothetical protein
MAYGAAAALGRSDRREVPAAAPAVDEVPAGSSNELPS